MVKTISVENKDSFSQHLLHTQKDGFIQKKKNQKFKQTPVGKVALINGSKALSNNNMKEQNLQKKKNISPQKSEEKNKEKQKDSSKIDTNQQEPSKKTLNKRINLVQTEDSNSESEEDINEGIMLGEQSLIEESDENEESDDESEEEIPVTHVLGTSLADESDEDDDDYEEEEEDVPMNKGIKMFKGLSDSSMNDTIDSKIEEESEEDDDDDEEENEDDDDDEENEDDDEENDDDDDDDDDDDENEDDDDDDADDDSDLISEEDEDEEEADESALGLKALLSNTIGDDDDEDDEDFVAPGDNEDDVDMSDEDEDEDEEEENNTSRNSGKNSNRRQSKDESKRTIFVGNLPKDVTRKALIKHFKQFGQIDSVRIRGIISKMMNVPKKVAAITKEVHPKLKTVYAYVKYVSEESAKAALSKNGTMFLGNHLKVDMGNDTENRYDGKRTVFLGNLNFDIDEDTIRKHFKKCGEIEFIRIIKDNMTGVGKGFGYVNFKTEDAVALALELNGTVLVDREIRVKPHIIKKDVDSPSKLRKRSHPRESTENTLHKKIKTSNEASISNRNKTNDNKRVKKQKIQKTQTSPQQGNAFQGQKADANKKKRKNKGDKKKKILAEILTSKSKKPTN